VVEQTSPCQSRGGAPADQPDVCPKVRAAADQPCTKLPRRQVIGSVVRPTVAPPLSHVVLSGGGHFRAPDPHIAVGSGAVGEVFYVTISGEVDVGD
jgi:hypothetical protein